MRVERLQLMAPAAEAYGDSLDAFLATPRRSLGMRTPAQALAAGGLDAVRRLIGNAVEDDQS